MAASVSPLSTQRRREKRKRLLERDGDRCWVCEKPMPRKDRSIDHVVRLADGGGHELENLRLAHRRCNNERHDERPPAGATLPPVPKDTPSKREWIIRPYSYEVGDDPEAQITQQLLALLCELAPVVSRIGGALAVAADRAEIAPGTFQTEHVVVRWESFVPARRLPREAPAPTPVPDPEPETLPGEIEDEAEVPEEAEVAAVSG